MCVCVCAELSVVFMLGSPSKQCGCVEGWPTGRGSRGRRNISVLPWYAERHKQPHVVCGAFSPDYEPDYPLPIHLGSTHPREPLHSLERVDDSLGLVDSDGRVVVGVEETVVAVGVGRGEGEYGTPPAARCPDSTEA